MRRFLIPSMLGMFLGLPCAGYAMTEPDCSEIPGAVDGFLAAYEARDADAIIGAMPPDYLEAHADRLGVGAGFYRSVVVSMTAAALTAGAIEELEFDLAATACGTTTDGRTYGLVPTRSIARKNGARQEILAETLALRDAGRWWLIQVNDENQISVLREVYPAFREVRFAPPQRTSVE